MMAVAAVFLPLAGAALAALLSRRASPALAGITTTCLAALALAASLGVLAGLGDDPTRVSLATWIVVDGLHLDWALRADPLSALMLVVVNAISALVHLYAIGYMAEDPHRPRFFAFLSLFTFSMLLLVSADNFLQLFCGWEGVGLSSYLLIGFWYERSTANAAAIKAFLMNRIGDVGLVLALAAIALTFESLTFDAVFGGAADAGSATLLGLPALEVIGVLLLVGAMGKSAQIGLHTWLADAMEGPTPVSALLHAATMVTAGVFLVARCAPLYEGAPVAMGLVAVVGAATALFAATIALAQTDIKRVVAWSTCSQLGYMFLAAGVAVPAAALFHLFTHAFFKALLFLGAGAVIHALAHEQDLRRMGGLARRMPLTCTAMVVGSLALSGLPPFAGFWSKDVILESAFAAHGPVALTGFWMGLAAAFLTGLYSWRLVFLVFAGEARAPARVLSAVHEPGWSMRFPVLVLAAAACVAGWWAHDLADAGTPFWRGLFATAHHGDVPAWVPIAPAVAGAGGLLVAWLVYVARPELGARAAARTAAVGAFLAAGWRFDALYDGLVVRTVRRVGSFLAAAIDQGLIDRRGPEGVGRAALAGAVRVQFLQTGQLHHYALVVVVGAVLFAAWNLLVGGLS